MNHVCRPKVLTCRWMEEFTKAIHIVCPDAPMVKCNSTQSLEETWNQYEKDLMQSRCLKNDTVQKIVLYEMDYNDVLTPSQR